MSTKESRTATLALLLIASMLAACGESRFAFPRLLFGEGQDWRLVIAAESIMPQRSEWVDPHVLMIWLLALCTTALPGCTERSSTTANPDYELVRPDLDSPLERNQALHFTADGVEIHVFHAQHQDHPDVHGTTTLMPIYDRLIDRDRYLERQPEPLDDITGDGLPNLVIMELDPGGSAPGSPDYWITVLTLRGHAVEVHPAFHGRGEVLFFDDLDGDGSLEFIAGELDYDKLEGRRMIPTSPRVRVFDPAQRRYRRTAPLQGTDP